ncbi:GNAT family N-acetyltransferase [bacterium]|nr:GNAT family N-acetyltransferase [bacterium]
MELPEESMLSRISRSTRKKIKHEIRLPQIEMITADHPDQIDICYDILQKSYRHNCVPLADKSLFINAFRILHPKKMILFTLAKFKNEYIAASVDLLFKNTMYGWYGGFDRDYAKLLPNEMIMWHLLSWGAKNHYQWYDFGGAGQPEQKYGVRNFKAKFGGNLVNYGRYLNVHAPLRYCLGTVSYKILQKLSKLCRMRFIK